MKRKTSRKGSAKKSAVSKTAPKKRAAAKGAKARSGKAAIQRASARQSPAKSKASAKKKVNAAAKRNAKREPSTRRAAASRTVSAGKAVEKPKKSKTTGRARVAAPAVARGSGKKAGGRVKKRESKRQTTAARLTPTLEREAKRLDNSRLPRYSIPSRLSAEKKILHLARKMVELASGEIDPYLDIPSRTLSNVNYSQRKRIIEMGDGTQRRSFFNLAQAKKFMQTLLVARGCSQLLSEGKTTSIRDLYYMSKHTLGDTDENTFEEQDESDPVIEDLEVALGSLREELHLFASKRGSVVGPLTIVDSGDTIDLSRMGSGGWSVPGIVESDVIRFKRNEAKYVLLVEKEAVWARLNEDRFWKKHKCILVTGQGQPPRGVRRLLHRLVNELRLPLIVFVDNDPWGYYIHSVVKQGSINLAYESQRMAIPSARFLGLSSFDHHRFGFSADVSIKLTDQDRVRAKEILAYPWFKERAWQKEIRNMLSQGVKWELEALSNKGLSFVTEEYLPKKIKDRSWI